MLRRPNRGETRRRRRHAVAAFSCLGLVALGAGLGRSMFSETGSVRVVKASMSTRTITATPPPAGTAGADNASRASRSPDGAAAAAGSYLVALGGDAILDPVVLDASIRRIASREAVSELRTAYAAASRNIRDQFGLAGQPRPVVILRSVPLAFHVDSFTPSRAVVSIWDLGIVGSGGSVDPQASWRTETISLIWQEGTWKASNFTSVAGPVPALASRDQPSPPADLFTFVPSLEEYTRVAP